MVHDQFGGSSRKAAMTETHNKEEEIQRQNGINWYITFKIFQVVVIIFDYDVNVGSIIY